MLVANKKDKVEGNPRMKEVSTEEGMRRAEAMGARYIETSAFTGECVNEAFETFIREARLATPSSSVTRFAAKIQVACWTSPAPMLSRTH